VATQSYTTNLSFEPLVLHGVTRRAPAGASLNVLPRAVVSFLPRQAAMPADWDIIHFDVAVQLPSWNWKHETRASYGGEGDVKAFTDFRDKLRGLLKDECASASLKTLGIFELGIHRLPQNLYLVRGRLSELSDLFLDRENEGVASLLTEQSLEDLSRLEFAFLVERPELEKALEWLEAFIIVAKKVMEDAKL
jgi:hypothetical protein